MKTFHIYLNNGSRLSVKAASFNVGTMKHVVFSDLHGRPIENIYVVAASVAAVVPDEALAGTAGGNSAS